MAQKEYTHGHGFNCGCCECLANWMYEHNPNQLLQWEQQVIGYEGVGYSIKFSRETMQILEPRIKEYLQSLSGTFGQKLRHRFITNLMMKY